MRSPSVPYRAYAKGKDQQPYSPKKGTKIDTTLAIKPLFTY